MFGRLQKLDQIALLKTMPPEKFKRFYPIFFGKGKNKLAYDPEINALAQKYFAQP
jgi:hypothetical protein